MISEGDDHRRFMANATGDHGSRQGTVPSDGQSASPGVTSPPVTHTGLVAAPPLACAGAGAGGCQQSGGPCDGQWAEQEPVGSGGAKAPMAARTCHGPARLGPTQSTTNGRSSTRFWGPLVVVLKHAAACRSMPQQPEFAR